jgi:hypothetical protein
MSISTWHWKKIFQYQLGTGGNMSVLSMNWWKMCQSKPDTGEEYVGTI